MAKETLLEKMKRKAEEASKRKEERKNFDNLGWFKPEVGDNVIRILPHWKSPNSEVPFVENTIHYVPLKKRDGGVYNGPIRCLEDLDGDCPICEKWLEAKAENPKGKITGDLRPTRRVLFNVISYGLKGSKSDPKILVWSCPESVYEEILGWLGDLGEFWDIESGRNWRIRKTVDKKRGVRMGTEYKVYPEMRDTAIPEKFMPMLKDMADLDKVWEPSDIEVYNDALKSIGVDGEFDDEIEVRKSKKLGTKVEFEDEEEIEDDEEEEVPVRKSKKIKRPVKKVEEEIEDEEEEVPVRKSKKTKMPVKTVEDEEIEDEDDDDLEAELRELGL